MCRYITSQVGLKWYSVQHIHIVIQSERSYNTLKVNIVTGIQRAIKIMQAAGSLQFLLSW